MKYPINTSILHYSLVITMFDPPQHGEREREERVRERETVRDLPPRL